MKRRMTALLLCAALLAALGVNAATAERPKEEETPAVTAAVSDEAAPDEDGALSLSHLRAQMLESYYPLLAIEESIRMLDELNYESMEKDLRDTLNAIADMQWASISASASALDPAAMAGMTPAQIAGAAGASAASAVVSPVVTSQLQTQYDACKEAFDKVHKGELQADNEGVKRQLRNLQDQTVIMAETLFITCKGLDAQDTALARTIAALERTEKELTLRNQLGQVSALTLQQVSVGLSQARSGRQTLRMNRDNLLLQLKAMCGAALDAPLNLGALPRVSAAQLAAMDMEADLAAAREVSYELYDAKKTYDDAKKDYDDARDKYGDYSGKNEWMQAKHSWQAAQYTYENAKQSFELRFRALYAQVKDAAQVLDAKRAAVSAQEQSYAADSLRFKQGSISANALADARDQLAEAKDAAASAERDLYTQYHNYENAVTYGILNS